MTTGGGAGGAPATSTTSATGGTGGTGGSTGAGGDETLVNRELVVRYFLDEAAGGTGPPTAVDAAGNLDLTHEYFDSFYVDPGEPGFNRALRWSAPGLDGGPVGDVEGTRVSAALSGADRVTVELVLRTQGFVNMGMGSTIFGISLGDADETLEIGGRQGNVRVFWNDIEGPQWSRTPLEPRAVMHVVFDSGAATANERVTVYIDGAEVATQGTLANASPLPSPLTGRLRIGNDFNGFGRSLEGNIFYAAVYATAFSAQDAAFNAARLSASDDTDPAD